MVVSSAGPSWPRRLPIRGASSGPKATRPGAPAGGCRAAAPGEGYGRVAGGPPTRHGQVATGTRRAEGTARHRDPRANVVVVEVVVVVVRTGRIALASADAAPRHPTQRPRVRRARSSNVRFQPGSTASRRCDLLRTWLRNPFVPGSLRNPRCSRPTCGAGSPRRTSCGSSSSSSTDSTCPRSAPGSTSVTRAEPRRTTRG